MGIIKDEDTGQTTYIGPEAENVKHVLRDKKSIAKRGATPNEVAAGLAEPDVKIERRSDENVAAEERAAAIDRLADAIVKKVR